MMKCFKSDFLKEVYVNEIAQAAWIERSIFFSEIFDTEKITKSYKKENLSS